MAKSKESKEAEFYLGQIRSLKAENRNLKKRLKTLERQQYNYKESKEDKEIEEEIRYEKEQQLDICPNCSRRGITEIIIVGRMFKRCEICSWRSKATQIK